MIDVYLDNAATTKVDPQVLEEMIPYFTDIYGNASSKHKFGLTASDAIKIAREKIASLINSSENEIIFTSGATEGINLSIKGVVNQYRHKGNHLITVATEHSAVLDTCKYLEQLGIEITYLGVDPEGIINLTELKNAIKDSTILISVMYANNETGVIQPIEDIARICHSENILFMSDATQAVGKIPIDIKKLDVDIMPFSAHKFHGPKGVGGLFLRNKGQFKAKVVPLIHGGGHERGVRSGTLNVPAIVGFGKACEIARNEMVKNIDKMLKLRMSLENELLKINDSHLNGNESTRLPNITNIRFDNIDCDALLLNLSNIALAKGSACSSSSLMPSHVLLSMGLSEQEALSSIRVSLSKYSSHDELGIFINLLKLAIRNIRTLLK